MPSRPRRPCQVAGCPGFAEHSSRCPRHQRQRVPCSTAGCPGFAEHQGRCRSCLDAKGREIDARRPTASQRGYGAHWQRTRRSFLRRNPSCAWCGAAATVVDHVTPLRLGGTDGESNYQPLCRGCHTKKTAQEMHTLRCSPAGEGGEKSWAEGASGRAGRRKLSRPRNSENASSEKLSRVCGREGPEEHTPVTKKSEATHR